MRDVTKVGDTVTANVTPADATNVVYQWYTGDSATALNSAISGATSKDLVITEDMIGKFVGVVVNGDNNSTANAVSAVAVQKADSAQIAIIEAKQSGAKTVEVKFNAAVTANDKITVKKGSTDVKVDKIDYNGDFTGAFSIQTFNTRASNDGCSFHLQRKHMETALTIILAILGSSGFRLVIQTLIWRNKYQVTAIGFNKFKHKKDGCLNKQCCLSTCGTHISVLYLSHGQE